jgi:hypothetical protein
VRDCEREELGVRDCERGEEGVRHCEREELGESLGEMGCSGETGSERLVDG